MNWRENWDRVFDIIRGLPDLVWHNLRACATQEMINDGFEEVGSSDINHVVYSRVQGCKDEGEIIKVALEWCNEML